MASSYAELQAKTNFSFLRGASYPHELVRRAGDLGLAALGVTDRDSLAGVVRAHVAAKEQGLRLLIGAEVVLGGGEPSGGPAVLLYPGDRAAYARLSRLLSLGRSRAAKGACELELEDVLTHASGLLAVAVPPPGGWWRRPEASVTFSPALGRLREAFGDRLYAALQCHRVPLDAARNAAVREAARGLGVPTVVTGDVHYHDRARQPLQDALVAVREGCTLAEAGWRLFPNAERCLRSPREVAALFPGDEGALARTLEVMERARFRLEELRYEYPEELAPPGLSPAGHLARLVREAARRRYGGRVPEAVRRRLREEMALIAELGYEGFFLTVHDLVRFARSRGILCQGRGSAANSVVCYVLGITAVDPERIDLLFERFVSRERNEPPDIDVDFEHERREEVIQYLYARYGRERAALVAEVIGYRTRSALRDLGRVFGLSRDLLERLTSVVDPHEVGLMPARAREAGLDPEEPVLGRVLRLAGELVGFPRHLSQHVGGFVITRGPLCELVPIENAAMEGRTVVQWDKDDIDELGILKVDVLGLGMLTALRKSFDLVAASGGPRLSLATVPPEDPATYAMLREADSVGVFQVESRAQMAMLPRLAPRCFYDLVVEVALVRPGPISGGMVHPYLRRRRGGEPVSYPSEAVRRVLEKTLGVPIFQEQVMRLAVEAAGFTPGEADRLRRAMGAWRARGSLEPWRRRLMEGMAARGIPEVFARQVYECIRGFGEYGFPESHAASFALLTYVSAWMKRHHPAAFAAALLNSQPMGFYAPAQVVSDARSHGVEVRPVDVNASATDCTLEPGSGPASDGRPALRLGLRMVRGLARARLEALAEARSGGAFRSVADLARRTGLPSDALASLAAAGALAPFGLSRRAALWEALGEGRRQALHADEGLPLLAGLDPAEAAPRLPEPSAAEEVAADYQALGLSLGPHPVALLRGRLARMGVVPAADLARADAGTRAVVAGLVLVRQRPVTGQGVIFCTLEDETGWSNLVVRIRVFERFRRVVLTAPFLVARGRVERDASVVHLVADSLEELPGERVPGPGSRDFQ
ncbi:MAG: error-prone DNA polymerase [Planctomycetes bacterium]|nr:error-prone DNA polymerase [Planctomycetota bacterium]